MGNRYNRKDDYERKDKLVHLRFDSYLLKGIDFAANKYHCSKSEIVRRAVNEFLDRMMEENGYG